VSKSIKAKAKCTSLKTVHLVEFQYINVQLIEELLSNMYAERN